MEQIKLQLFKLNDKKPQILKTGLSVVTAYTIYKGIQNYTIQEEILDKKNKTNFTESESRNRKTFNSNSESTINKKKTNNRKEVEIVNTKDSIFSDNINLINSINVVDVENKDEFILKDIDSLIIEDSKYSEKEKSEEQFEEKSQQDSQEYESEEQFEEKSQQDSQEENIYIEDSEDTEEDEEDIEINNQRYLEEFISLQNNGIITPVKAITFFVKKNITVKQLKETYQNCKQELNQNISFDTFCKISQLIDNY